MKWWTAVALVGLAACKSDQGFNDQYTSSGAALAPPFAIADASARAHVGFPLTLDGSASYDPDDDLDRFELLYSWVVVDSPEGAVFRIDNPTAKNPTFTADTLGVYEVELTVVDVDELESRNPAGTLVEVTPWTHMELILEWDQPGIDLDLHLIAPDGEYFTDSDCYFGNPEPDWGEEGSNIDNPVLLRDDEGDHLEEIIELTAPELGSFGIGVHYFNPKDAEILTTTPTIRLSAEGEEMLEIEGRMMSMTGQVQVFGFLDWNTMEWDERATVTTHDALGGPPVNKRRF